MPASIEALATSSCAQAVPTWRAALRSAVVMLALIGLATLKLR